MSDISVVPARSYLSFGGGVNSTALGLWLLEQGIDAEWVYADHGSDWPETREYVQMLKDRGYPITILETRREGLPLYEYYLKHRFVPVRWARACTRLYKLVPLSEYFQTPCTVYLGISADESHRVERIIAGHRKDEEKLFPLVDEGIDRRGCIEIIKAHGLPVPMKSGCFLCPFQRRSQWLALRRLHPDLYCKAKRLEDATNERLVLEGREPIYIADKPLDVVCQDGQADMFAPERSEPCLCEI